MIKELAANHDKGDRDGDKGWIHLDKKVLLSEIYYHTGKLQAALMSGDIELIKEHTADIANGALMICDKFCNLKPTNESIKTNSTTGTG